MPVNTSTAPFFDDYDENKGFHQILFRPKRVQTRELNQLQTILQQQIARFGSHIFQDGSVVGKGALSIRENQSLIKCAFPSSFDTAIFSDPNESFSVKSRDGNLSAKVLKFLSDGSNSGWLAIEYTNSENAERKEYNVSELLTLSHIVANAEVSIGTISITELKLGFYVGILEGYYFINGKFVLTKDQSLIIPDDNVTCLVGFNVVESIVDETEDVSLYSNAAGEPNFKGAGAARLKYELQLQRRTFAEKDQSYVELVRIENGVLQRKIDTSQYSTLNDTLAQRTYEESGDYTVTHFPVEIIDHLRSEFNPDGMYSSTDGGDETKYITRLKKGVAYVRGYRHEIIGYQDIVKPKARDTKIVNNGVMPAQYGSYIIVNVGIGLPKLSLGSRHNLVNSGNQPIGSAIVRAVKRESDTRLRIYLTDIILNGTNTFSDVKVISLSTSSTDSFETSLLSSVIYGGSSDSLVYRLPYDSVKTLSGSGGQDLTYTVTRSWDIALDGSGAASVSLTGSEIFGSINPYDYLVAVSGTNTYLGVGGLSLGGSPIGKLLTINYGPSRAGNVIRVIATVLKTNPTYKTKVKKSEVQTISFNNRSSVTLNKADIYNITEVINLENGADITQAFTFYDGQRPNWYEAGEIIHKNGNFTGNLRVTYEFLEHSVSGDFFSVDSYTNMEKKDIPYTKETGDRETASLSDCLDFRLIKNGSGIFENAPLNFDVIQPNDNIRFDLTYYLPRIDTVYLTAEGIFDIQLGNSTDNPIAPVLPDNAMGLYNLYVPAYTEDANQIIPKKVENQRYTMKDIGKLEKRLENVEYYVNLSQLESKTERTQVLDPVTGNNRFKNGFAADGFTDFRLLDVLDEEWDASIDLAAGKVMPSLLQNGIDLDYLSGGRKGKTVISLPYTEKELTSQPYATDLINVNPFAVFTWAGSVRLYPTSDFWKDTVYNPPIVVNITNDLTEGKKAGTEELSKVLSSTLWDQGWLTYRTDTTTTTYQNTQIQSSYEVDIQNTQESLRLIPYMRAIAIDFELTNFKPLTRVYPFFSGVNVSSATNQNGKAVGESIITDMNGSAKGTFTVPTLSSFRFKNGMNILRFTDSPTDSRTIEDNASAGEAIFTSGGELETRQETFTTTTTLRATTSKWTTSGSTTTLVRNRDPIAQTFRVGTVGGAFISKVRVFFQSKAKTIPVTLQIRPVQNGLPTGEVLTFGEVTLNPGQVNVSGNGVVGTDFVFEDLVYLQENTEYAIVLLADTQEYNVFISRMGGIDMATNYVVAKQPHTGVMLVSSNGSTWTPNQTDDMKFTVYGAEFDTTPREVTFRSKQPIFQALDFNAFSTITGSNVITVYKRGHGLKAGDYTEFTSITSGNGITSDTLNKVIRVDSATLDRFTVTSTDFASVTGNFGGSQAKYKPNYTFTNVNPRFNSLVLDGTSAGVSLSYYNQLSRGLASAEKLKQNEMNELAVEGVISNTTHVADLKFVLESTNKNLSPLLDLDGIGIEAVGKRINNELATPAMVVPTKTLRFDNPSTSAKIYVVAKLPYGSSMKLFFKPLISGDENLKQKDWIEISPEVAPQNSNNTAYESVFTISDIGAFLGYKLKIVCFGEDPVLSPVLTELRTIALA